jgi:hypothetical protein
MVTALPYMQTITHPVSQAACLASKIHIVHERDNAKIHKPEALEKSKDEHCMCVW